MALAIGASLGAANTVAQEQTRALEEIVVSALKGSTGTALSDTAMGITAFEGAYLEDIAATSINAIIERTPGASLVRDGATATTIQIRGISASQGDALVGYYLDDFAYVSLQGVSTPEVIPFDLKRVEVLKGPQGTLYGAGSTGGTIRILSNTADTHEGFSGKVELGAHTISGGGDGNTIAGMVNIPIVADKLALRASAYLRDRGGWLDYDEGPFYQTDRFDRYAEVTQKLLEEDKAYHCYCSRLRSSFSSPTHPLQNRWNFLSYYFNSCRYLLRR